MNLKDEVTEVDIIEEKFNGENNAHESEIDETNKNSETVDQTEIMNVILGTTTTLDNGNDSEDSDMAQSVEETEHERLKDNGLGKYSMPLESERGLYITGATILAMKGIISFKEYTTNQFEKHIPQEFLDKKFYLGEILGAIRGMTRLKLAMCKDRLPSVTMCDHMKKEEDELVANGCMFVTDSEESDDDEDLNEESPVNGVNHSGEKEAVALNGTSQSKKKSQRKKNRNKLLSQVITKRSVVNKEKDKNGELPDELLNCGNCGISINGILHLDRHLERCRGPKRKLSSESESKSSKSFRSAADELATCSGTLYVCDTNDGEVINGWESSMKGIPPGPTCPWCAFEVPTLYDLPLHQRFHTGSDIIVCPLCTFSTCSLPVYLIHVEEHAS